MSEYDDENFDENGNDFELDFDNEDDNELELDNQSRAQDMMRETVKWGNI